MVRKLLIVHDELGEKDLSCSIALSVSDQDLTLLQQLPELTDQNREKNLQTLCEKIREFDVKIYPRFLAGSREPQFVGSACKDLIKNVFESEFISECKLLIESDARKQVEHAFEQDDTVKNLRIDFISPDQSLALILTYFKDLACKLLEVRENFDSKYLPLADGLLNLSSWIMLRPRVSIQRNELTRKKIKDSHDTTFQWAKNINPNLVYDPFIRKKGL